ncbi:MAG: glycosyltransferase family 2 protein [Deltaproteobacteria bacterium]|nr:glycosyltransferase family 2 protein [Deltaproteobacteria bacterium]
MEISIIIPVYNEERNIRILVEKIRELAVLKDKIWEAIFIDDGSTDNTYGELKSAKEGVPEVKIVHFGINAGKAAAYSAGFQFAAGSVIITMDGDLQDDPAEIGSFLAALTNQSDLVVGWKYRGKGSRGRTIPSRIFNFFLGILTGLKINDSNCPFRAMRKEVAKSLNIYGDLYRFIPYLAFNKGYRVAEIKVENYPRQYGKSKYGPGRFFNGMLDLLTVLFISRYNRSPLHFFGIPGLISFVIGFAIDATLVLRGLFVTGQIGHTALLVMGVMLIILGVQILSLGLLGELIISQRRADRRDLPILDVIQ